MSEKTADVVRELMKNGIMATEAQVIDADTAELITTEFGHKVKRVSESDIELEIISKNERIGRNPKTKEQFLIKKRKSISFISSKNLTKIINQ